MRKRWGEVVEGTGYTDVDYIIIYSFWYLKYLIKTKKWCEHCHCNRVQHSACLRTKMGRKCTKNSGDGEIGTWVS